LGGATTRRWRRRVGTEVLREESPPFVVAPGVVDVEVAGGVSFAGEAGLCDEAKAAVIAGLDVGFDAMQGEGVKRLAQDEPEALLHEAVSGVGDEGVESERGVLEVSADDMVQVDHADEGAGAGQADEAAQVGPAVEPPQVKLELGGAGRGLDPWGMKRPAGGGGLEEGLAIARLGRAYGDGGISHSRILASRAEPLRPAPQRCGPSAEDEAG